MKIIKLVYLVIVSCILCVLSLGQVTAQEDTTQVEEAVWDMGLEDLMNIEVTVASKNAMSIRETPGIVTVLTEDEIVNSGASDLMEVLRLVPGFEFGVDVSGATGMTLRGNMGYIGRVLLMIDGQEVNELFYSCSFSDNHYSVDNIKRIEIIRGPGTAMYGGFAELGVINVITKNGEDLDGISAAVNYGHLSNTFAHQNVSISAGKKFSDDFMFSLSGFYSQANRSDREVFDMYGESYDMTDQSLITSMVLNSNVKFKGLNVRFILDDYLTNRRDQYDLNMMNAYDTRYKLFMGEAKYDFKLSDKITVTPKYNAVYSVPWQSLEDIKDGDDGNYMKYDKRALRNRINLSTSLDLTDDLNIVAGGEYIMDKGQTHIEDEVFWNGEDNISYATTSGFAQAILKTKIVNMTVGARFDSHSHFGTGFAPRIGFTRAFDKLHVKLLLSQAYRAPSFDEIDYAAWDAVADEPKIGPEITRVGEFEVGYGITEEIFINANAFYSVIENTILYTVVQGVEGYSNTGNTGSKGFEVELKVKKDWGFANLNYSFYSAKDINKVDYYRPIDYSVLDNPVYPADNQLVGTSPHKVSLNSSFNVFKTLYVSPSLTFMGEKYAYTYADYQYDSNGDVVFYDTEDPTDPLSNGIFDEDFEDAEWVTYLEKQDPVLLFNLYINYKDLLVEGLDVSVGVHNLLDAEYNFSQPYNGWHSPLPSEGRRISVKLTYDLSFSKE